MARDKAKSPLQQKWDAYLASQGMPANLPLDSSLGERVSIGLGVKSERQERAEDGGRYHSGSCPIRLGYGLNDEVDQPGDNPVERLFTR